MMHLELQPEQFNRVQPLLADTKKDTLKAIHTDVVTKAFNSREPNRVLGDHPPPINTEETTLRRPQRSTLSQLRSGHCRLLSSYRNRLDRLVPASCPDCGSDPQDVQHLFDCREHPNALTPVDMWNKPVNSIREFAYLEPSTLE